MITHAQLNTSTVAQNTHPGVKSGDGNLCIIVLCIYNEYHKIHVMIIMYHKPILPQLCVTFKVPKSIKELESLLA